MVQETATDVVPTMVIPVELPTATMSEFLADMKSREDNGMEWQTLPQWLEDMILPTLLKKHQARVYKRKRKVA